ncbi:MAG: type II toxin-antitoxin system YafQ family toxin [Rickettsiales bacterium]|jgi:addiction module RelE/StbE family toxin|nr:type II toxin-antitoxin system YafQ family toxin [Rickettsiales bacterium]
MRRLFYRRTFLRDIDFYRRKRGALSGFKSVMRVMRKLDGGLDGCFRDHALSGDMRGYRQVRVARDIFVVYRLAHDNIIFIRLGTKKELYG